MQAILTICLILFMNSTVLKAAVTNMAQANGIEIWHETFGEKKDPALLLIMGACAQGILWPTEFCEKLANAGFYVIRYDHRDAGLSTCFNFEKQPYDLLDMAKDAIGLLDFLDVKAAHVFGLSMGGPIAELVAAHNPSRVLSVTLMATSLDFVPLHRALDGLPQQEGALSGPKECYIASVNQIKANPPKTYEEKIAKKIERWKLLNGAVVPFEENLYVEIYKQVFERIRCSESSNNHLYANRLSENLIKTAPSQVHVPTLILHGSEDPIFPPDHAEALSRAILDSKYVLVEGMGHIINCHFYDLLVKEIAEVAKRNKYFNHRDR